jgi:hypothetical protein
LSDKFGAYRMQGSRMIWKVSVVQGKLALTDHLDGTYRWQALSPMRFRALEGPHQGTNTLVFNRDSDKRLHMRLEADDRLKADLSNVDFELVRTVTPDTKQLSDYAGRYYGAELNAIYTFSVRDGSLFMQVNNHRHEQLSPMVADEFIPSLRTPDEGRIITFVRDADHRVAGISVGLWRIQGIALERLN